MSGVLVGVLAWAGGVAAGWAAAEYFGGFRIRAWQRQVSRAERPGAERHPGTLDYSRALYELKSRGLDPRASSEARRFADVCYGRRSWIRRI